jgi:hypothetical protein
VHFYYPELNDDYDGCLVPEEELSLRFLSSAVHLIGGTLNSSDVPGPAGTARGAAQTRWEFEGAGEALRDEISRLQSELEEARAESQAERRAAQEECVRLSNALTEL